MVLLNRTGLNDTAITALGIYLSFFMFLLFFSSGLTTTLYEAKALKSNRSIIDLRLGESTTLSPVPHPVNSSIS